MFVSTFMKVYVTFQKKILLTFLTVFEPFLMGPDKAILGYFGTKTGTFWHGFGPLLGRSGVIFGSFRCHFDIILGHFGVVYWCRFGVVLGSFWALIRTFFWPFWGILAHFWSHV